MKFSWIAVILPLLFSGCGDVNSRNQAETELRGLFSEFYEVSLSEPEFLHAPIELRAEYEKQKLEVESGKSSISKERLAEFFEYIQKSEEKADQLREIRRKIEEISKEHPNIDTHEISRSALLAIRMRQSDGKGDVDPFR